MGATGSAAVLRPLLAKLIGVALVVGLAAPAAAVVVPFRAGRLTIRVDLLGAQYSMWAPASGPATGTVNVNRTATTLGSFTLPAGSFSVLGATVPVADPRLQPITGLTGSFENEEGVFSSQGGTLGGTMGLSFPGYPAESAVLEVCLLHPCEYFPPFLLLIPLSVVGTGGQETGAFDEYSLTITGAPWTIGSASVPIQGGQATESGSLTVLPDGWMRVRLVTPIAIDWDGPDVPPTGIPAQIAGFGLLDLEIAPVPEPTAAGAGLASLTALSALAHRRRRGAQFAAAGKGTRSSRCTVPSAKVATR